MPNGWGEHARSPRVYPEPLRGYPVGKRYTTHIPDGTQGSPQGSLCHLNDVVKSPPGTIGGSCRRSSIFCRCFFHSVQPPLGLIRGLSAEFPHNYPPPPICSLSAEIRSNLPSSNLPTIHRNSAQFSLQSADYPPTCCLISPLDLQTVRRNRRPQTVRNRRD